MTYLAHQFHLVFQRLTTFVSCILLLFRKSFDCHHSFISESFSEVDSSEGAFAYLFFGLKQLMKASLIDPFLKMKSPGLDYGGMGGEGELLWTSFSLQFDGGGVSEGFFGLGKR